VNHFATIMRFPKCLCLFGLLSLATQVVAAPIPDLRDGDIIFHTSRSTQSLAVQRATGSSYSHMGIIFIRDGKPHVFEAISTVSYTPIDRWIARGLKGEFALKRLRKPLNSDQIKALRLAADKFKNKPYDLTFEWSDSHIYCSELVWKLYKRALDIQIGDLQKLQEFHLTDPAVQAKLQERYGTKIPLEEPVISPIAMFQSPLLITLTE